MPAATVMKADYVVKLPLFCLADRVWAIRNFEAVGKVIARGSAKGNYLTAVGAALGFVGMSQMSSECRQLCSVPEGTCFGKGIAF